MMNIQRKSQSFMILERDFVQTLQLVNTWIENSPDAQNDDKIYQNIKKCEALLQQIHLEARSSPQSHNLINTYMEYQDRLSMAKNKILGYMEAKRGALPYKTTDIHQMASQLLASANSAAIESEDIGLNIMGELKNQRGTLMSAGIKAEDTQHEFKEARHIIKSLIHSKALSRIILICTIILLALGIIIVLIFGKFAR